jgi:teichuronic acid biosynthesis glycosyltransferase TuaC
MESDRELRVLFVIPGPPAGSSMIFAKRQVQAVSDRGAETAVCYLASRTRPFALLREWWQLRRMAREFRPQLVHAQFGTMTAFLTRVALRLPLVITFYGGDLNPVGTPSWLRSAAGRVLSQMASLGAAGLVCVSDELRGRLWWRRDEVVVIPTGVDTRVFYPRSRAQARATLGWEPAARVVLFNAGSDPRRKRLDLAGAAVAEARTRCGDIRFEVLDGTLDPESVPTVMNAADCLLVTSDSEGSPTVVQEAIACNLPVVSVDVGDVPQRLAKLPPSCIADRDPAALGRALAQVLAAPRPRHDAEVVREVALATVAGRLIQVYRRVLGSASH